MTYITTMTMSNASSVQAPSEVLHTFLETLSDGVRVTDYDGYHELVHGAGVPDAIRTVIEAQGKPLSHKGISWDDRFLHAGSRRSLIEAGVNYDTSSVHVRHLGRFLGLGIRRRESISFTQRRGDSHAPHDLAIIDSFTLYRVYEPEAGARYDAAIAEMNNFLVVAKRVLTGFVELTELS